MATTRFAFPFILGGQAQKHVTHNAALDVIDGLMVGAVASATTTVAPASPTDGECYIVPAGGVFGDVSAGSIALYAGGEWLDVPTSFGFSVLVLDEGRHRINGGSAGWVFGSVIGSQGGSLGLRNIDFEVDLSAAGAQATISAAIPSRAIVLGVTSWTKTAITGPAAYKVGTSGSLDQFGGSLGIAANSSNVGVVGPFATYSPTDLLITAQDDVTAFSAGVVALSALIIEPAPAPV